MTVKIDVYVDGDTDYYVTTFDDIRFVEIFALSKEYVILRLTDYVFIIDVQKTPLLRVTSKGLRIAYIGHKAKKQLKFASKTYLQRLSLACTI
jgi:hypothetical protein